MLDSLIKHTYRALLLEDYTRVLDHDEEQAPYMVYWTNRQYTMIVGINMLTLDYRLDWA